ncbi:MAG TPA: phosphopentomutase/phosphoglucosamine mutase [Methanoculleus sp.]|nr:phosphopentomutase/phosphoglucosamine mutase [Methanoculleus sp.]
MLFGSSGIRALYDRSLLDRALAVGSAVGMRAGRVVLGRDTRTTGPILAHAFSAGVLSSGGDVLDGTIAPTPTVAFATRHAGAGCTITASHNPEPYNGMKLVNPDGSAFTRAQQVSVEREIAERHWQDWKSQGRFAAADIISPHRESILRSVAPEGELSVVLDCGNGAGSRITPDLLGAAGIRVFCLNCNINGTFARPSEPLETNLPYIGEMIRACNAAAGIVHDGDADRMMAFDGRGRFISGDHLLMLFARYLGAQRVVTTVDASMAIDEIAEVQRTPVGDSYVSEHLLSWGDFGGEPSGSWIFPDHTLCPDGIYAAALFARIASEWDVAAEVDAMPRYPIVRTSFPVADPHTLLRQLGAEVPTDGIRIEEEDGWCLIRASGTEPKVRITAEGKTKAIAETMADRGHTMVKQVQ